MTLAYLYCSCCCLYRAAHWTLLALFCALLQIYVHVNTAHCAVTHVNPSEDDVQQIQQVRVLAGTRGMAQTQCMLSDYMLLAVKGKSDLKHMCTGAEADPVGPNCFGLRVRCNSVPSQAGSQGQSPGISSARPGGAKAAIFGPRDLVEFGFKGSSRAAAAAEIRCGMRRNPSSAS